MPNENDKKRAQHHYHKICNFSLQVMVEIVLVGIEIVEIEVIVEIGVIVEIEKIDEIEKIVEIETIVEIEKIVEAVAFVAERIVVVFGFVVGFEVVAVVEFVVDFVVDFVVEFVVDFVVEFVVDFVVVGVIEFVVEFVVDFVRFVVEFEVGQRHLFELWMLVVDLLDGFVAFVERYLIGIVFECSLVNLKELKVKMFHSFEGFLFLGVHLFLGLKTFFRSLFGFVRFASFQLAHFFVHCSLR